MNALYGNSFFPEERRRYHAQTTRFRQGDRELCRTTRDHTTVGKAIADLHRRFGFNRLVFVGDRGMVTSVNLDAITAGNHGYLVGLKRRRNKKLDKWLAAVDEAKWINCPVGITAREKADPPRTR